MSKHEGSKSKVKHVKPSHLYTQHYMKKPYQPMSSRIEINRVHVFRNCWYLFLSIQLMRSRCRVSVISVIHIFTKGTCAFFQNLSIFFSYQPIRGKLLLRLSQPPKCLRSSECDFEMLNISFQKLSIWDILRNSITWGEKTFGYFAHCVQQMCICI